MRSYNLLVFLVLFKFKWYFPCCLKVFLSSLLIGWFAASLPGLSTAFESVSYQRVVLLIVFRFSRVLPQVL